MPGSVYDRQGRSNRAHDPMTRISPHVGNVPGMNVPMGMVMNNQFGKKPPQTRTSNHRYSRRRTENEENGPLSQEMMTQQMNLTQGSMSQTGLSQGISQPMFSQGYGASQVGFSQDMHDISQSDSAWPKSQLDLLSQDQGYDAYNPSHGRGMDFSQY